MSIDVLVRGQQRPQELRPELGRDVEVGRELVDEAIHDRVEAVRLEVQKKKCLPLSSLRLSQHLAENSRAIPLYIKFPQGSSCCVELSCAEKDVVLVLARKRLCIFTS